MKDSIGQTTESAVRDTHGAAIYIGVQPRTLEDWRSKGRGPTFVRLGGNRVRYLVSDLDDFLISRRVAVSA